MPLSLRLLVLLQLVVPFLGLVVLLLGLIVPFRFLLVRLNLFKIGVYDLRLLLPAIVSEKD